jgi:hypothetical protein
VASLGALGVPKESCLARAHIEQEPFSFVGSGQQRNSPLQPVSDNIFWQGKSDLTAKYAKSAKSDRDPKLL